MEIPKGATTLDHAHPEFSGPETERSGERLRLPVLTVLSHADLSRVGDRALLSELLRGREVPLSRQEPRFTAPGSPSGAPLDDPFLSRSPLRLKARPGGGLRIHRAGSSLHLTVDGVPLADGLELSAGALEEGVLLDLAGRVALCLQTRQAPASPLPDRFGLVGESAGMEAVRQAVARVAPLGVPVLLRGETGTGKEIVARALHEHGPRSGRPFLAVNLGALPPTLAAAELFGAERGAYTGAVRDTPGYFVRAQGGTLFLDEIGEAPSEIQVMLLRALESQEVVPVGGQKPRRVDVRIVSATDSNLEEALRAGSFRTPLLHRLAGYSIRLPPLRQRREDFGRLLVHFLLREIAEMGDPPPPSSSALPIPWLPPPLVLQLARLDWPGNVRQLRNVARQLAIDSRGLAVLEAGPGIDDLLAAAGPVSNPPGVPRRRPSEIGEEEMIAALRAHHWSLKDTAAALGIARTSLYTLLERSSRVRPAAGVPPEEIRRALEHCGGDVAAMAAELEVSERALRQRLKDLGLR